MEAQFPEQGDVVAVEDFVAADPAAALASGMSLHAACTSSQPHLVDILLRHYSLEELRKHDRHTMTPIRYAAYRGAGEVVRRLLAHAPLEAHSNPDDSWCALQSACYYGFLDVADALIAHTATEDLAMRDLAGETLLHLAVHSEEATVLERMLEVVPEEVLPLTNHTSQTALHLAVEYGNARAVELLFLATPPDARGYRDEDNRTAAENAAHKPDLAHVFRSAPKAAGVLDANTLV